MQQCSLFIPLPERVKATYKNKNESCSSPSCNCMISTARDNSRPYPAFSVSPKVRTQSSDERIKRLEQQLDEHKQEIFALKSICGPTLTRLSLNCE